MIGAEKRKAAININMDYYKTFYYVAKSGSITKAAELLFNNQPNITRMMKKLEQELNCLLFERTRKGVTLTEEGKVLYQRMQVIMEELDFAMQDLEAMKKLEEGRIQIATTEIALYGVLLSVLQKYKSRYPGIQLSISNQNTKEALASVRTGEADFALVTGMIEPEKELIFTSLKTFSEIAVCHEQQKELLHSPVSLESLLSYPLITLNAATVHYEFYRQLFASHGLPFPASIYTASISQILPLVSHNLGIGFLPEFYFEAIPGYPQIHKIQLTDTIPQREIYLIKRRDKISSIAAKELEKFILSS